MDDEEIYSEDLMEAISLSGVSPELEAMSEQITADFLADPMGTSQPESQEPGVAHDADSTLPRLITSGKAVLDDTGKWVQKNSELTKIIASGIGNAVSSSNTKAAAATTAQGRIDELNQAAKLKQDQANTNSANVLAMRKPGIIGAQSQLQRNTGANVFDNGKYIKA